MKGYHWTPDIHCTQIYEGSELLISDRSGFAVGNAFPSSFEPGEWCWQAEHVPSNTQVGTPIDFPREKTKEEAKAAAEKWLSEQISKWFGVIQ